MRNAFCNSSFKYVFLPCLAGACRLIPRNRGFRSLCIVSQNTASTTAYHIGKVITLKSVVLKTDSDDAKRASGTLS